MNKKEEFENIKIEDFAKCDIRIGTVIDAQYIEGADKLIVFKVDLNETRVNEEGEETRHIRQILSGIREYYKDKDVLIGRQVPVLCNLPPRKLRGLESEGMILYAVGEGENFKILSPESKVENGTSVG